MKKGKKTILINLLVLTLMLLIIPTTVFASTINFTKIDVDSNVWTDIVSTTKDNSSTTATLKISNIYNASGGDSNYKKIQAGFTAYNGSSYAIANIEGTCIATKGTPLYPTLKSAYSIKGKTIYFSAMGNDPALDCQITGSFSAD